MPHTVPFTFHKFLEAISIPDDVAPTVESRRREILSLLGKSFEIVGAFPTGSLVRRTGLRSKSDLDVFVALGARHFGGRPPRQVLEDVRAALSDYNAQIVRKNGQAVTLYFKTWPNVDIVPAAMVGGATGFKIPNSNDGAWIGTNPLAHDRVVAGLTEAGRELVRIVKAWNHAHSGYFQSFHIEVIAAALMLSGDPGDTDDGWPLALSMFFDLALKMTEASTRISADYGVDDWSELRKRLRTAHELALDAWHAAYEYGDAKACIEKSRVLLGGSFPAYG